MINRSALIIFAVLAAFIGFAAVSTDVALAQGTFPGTYSCGWDDKRATSCQVDPARVNCTGDDVPGDACTFLSKTQCLSATKNLCVASQGEGSGIPKTPTAKTGTAGCEWDPKELVGVNKFGKCRSLKPSCVGRYEVPSWLNCEGINSNPKLETLKDKEAECKRLGEGRVACELPGEGGGSPKPEEGEGPPAGGISIKNPLNYGTIPDILNAIAGFLYFLALAVVTVMVLWAGFQILTAAGNPEGIDKGKRTLLWAVIGTVVILLAGGIADLTADILGGKSGSSSSSQDTGTASCSWVKDEGGGRRCAPDLNCETGLTAPRSLNCGEGDTQEKCQGIPAKNCVEE